MVNVWSQTHSDHFSSALCYWTAEPLSSLGRLSSVCPSSVLPSVKPVFSQTVKPINATFLGKLPVYRISKHFFVFQNFLFFYFFFTISFVFFNMGPYGRTKITRHLLWKCTEFFHSQKSCILLGRVSTTVVQRMHCEISNFGFCNFFFRFR